MRVYHSATSAWSRHPVPTRAARLTRAGPQPCAAAELTGLESNQRAPDPESGRDASNPPAIEYGRGESNSQTTRFERARYASSRHARLVRREGHDPSQPGLRVRCTAHLC